MDYQRTNVHPGPLVSDVLVLASGEHRSDRVWQDRAFADVPLKCVKFFGNLREGLTVERHQRVEGILRDYGFYGVERVSKLQIDWALITALVERWRPETHAFHLPFGEVGITLQDVEVLLGLPVDGTPVVGTAGNTKEYWAQMCADMMGFRPAFEDLSKTQIRMNAILLIAVSDQSGEVEFMQHARALMLRIMGGALFASTTGNKVNLCLLELLVGTAQQVRSRAIGAAVLACLYHNLCRAALAETAQIGGPLILLQIWAWERIPMCRPQSILPPEDVGGAPCGARWVCYHRWMVSSTHSIRPYRDQLDRLQESEFIWMPYPGPLDLHPHCTAGLEIWCTRAPLIYTYMVEMYYPDRFCRQLGGLQDIPKAVEYDRHLHVVRTTTGCMAPGTTHYVDQWDARHQSIVEIDLDNHGYTDAYREWYYLRGRRMIGNPEHRHVFVPGFVPVSPDVQCLLFALLEISRRTDVDPKEQGADPHALVRAVHDLAVQSIREAGYGHMLSHPGQVPAYEPEVIHRRPDRRRDAPVRGRPPRRQYHG